MVCERVSALLVVAVVITAHLLVRRILVDDFDEAFKAAEKGRDLCCKVDENIALFSGISAPADNHRGGLHVGPGQQFMRNETLIVKCPQQLVHVHGLLLGTGLDHDAVLLMPGLLRDSATEKKAVMRIFIQYIEIDPGHGQSSDLFSR